MHWLNGLFAWFPAHYDVLKDFASPTVTLIGFGVTATIAYFGFRSFQRWKREQLEERRMEVAFQALKLAYQSTFVFDNIRSPLVYQYEWDDMPAKAGENEHERSRRGSSYGIMKRLNANRDLFKDVWNIQPAFMAMFGEETKDIFYELHQARRTIEVACEMLHNHSGDIGTDKKLTLQLRADLSAVEGQFAPEGDRVGKHLLAFKTGIEQLCHPVVKHRH